MDRLLPTIVTVLVVLAIFALMLWGWRRRAARDRPAGAGFAAPASPGTMIAETDVLYVATTKGGEQLERLALPGLAFRGRAHLTVADDGVTIAVTGEKPVFIEAAALGAVGAATFTIDRVVEKDGLLRLSWTTSGGAAADSYLRVVDPADRASLIAAIETILPAGSQAGPTTESEV